MPKITRVDIVDGQTLEIELSNGHLLLFRLKHLLDSNPSYQSLRGKEVLPRPSTDGWSIFWRDGPRIALLDIFAMLNAQEA